MSINFFSLPRELRDNIYELLLVAQRPIVCLTTSWVWQPQLLAHTLGLLALTPGLLRTNKTVYLEASLMLYAQNCFDFTKGTSENTTLFFERIGRNNASHISFVRIDFPAFHFLDLNALHLEDDSVRTLAKIQSNCTRLSTIITYLPRPNAEEALLISLDCSKVVAETLALVDARFRAISSLKEIIVEVYEDDPSDYVKGEMKNHGWTMSEIEYAEDSDFDRAFNDFEDDDHPLDYDDGNDYDDGDGYGINNVNYFLKRAGD